MDSCPQPRSEENPGRFGNARWNRRPGPGEACAPEALLLAVAVGRGHFGARFAAFGLCCGSCDVVSTHFPGTGVRVCNPWKGMVYLIIWIALSARICDNIVQISMVFLSLFHGGGVCPFRRKSVPPDAGCPMPSMRRVRWGARVRRSRIGAWQRNASVFCERFCDVIVRNAIFRLKGAAVRVISHGQS